MFKDLKVSQVQMRLIIIEGASGGGRSVEVPCVSAITRFYLNLIPEAVFSVAAGTLAGTDILSNIHSGLDTLSQFRIQAWCLLIGDGGLEPWPDEEFLFFDGFVTDISSITSPGTSIVNISATHWLFELAAASALNSQMHPSAPADLSRMPIYNNTLKIGEDDLSKRSGTSLNLRGGPSFSISTEAIQQDMWQKGIKRSMEWLARYPPLISRDTETGISTATEGANPAVINTLNRMDDPNHITPGELGFKTAAQDIEKRIAQELGTQFFTQGFGQTFWHKLVNLTRSFEFSIVPTVSTATCAPVYPFLRDTWVTILPDYYTSVTSRSGTPRILRGLVGIGRATSRLGATPTSPIVEGISKFDLADFSDKYASGQILFSELPGWLSQLTIFKDYNSPKRITGRNTKESKPHIDGDLVDTEMLRAYTKTAFLSMATQHRSLEVNSILRFDIGPGSSVEILMSSASDLSANYVSHFGLVQGVELRLDAQTASVSTVFKISNIVTKNERSLQANGEQAFVENTHPMYNQLWNGCRLITF
jgi:hypothetical protein